MGANASFIIECRSWHDNPLSDCRKFSKAGGRTYLRETGLHSILFPVLVYEQTIVFTFANVQETRLFINGLLAWEMIILGIART